MGLIELQSVNATQVNPSWDRPVFLKGHCKDIPAIKKWKDKSYLRNKFNNAIIDVEVYKNKKDYQKSLSEKEQWKFNEYLNELNSDKQLYLSDCSLNTLYARSNIDQELFSDLYNSEDSIIGLDYPIDLFLYLGIDTKTGTHLHIETDYMINQIVGKKKIYCMEYKDLKLNNIFHKYNNFSKENFFELDWDKYNIYYAELEPGDSFCFPPWMWHAVESDGYSIGMTKVYERNEDYYKKYRKLQLRYMLNSKLPYLYNYTKDWLNGR
tara:strand:+ start:40 stop:837 length:798 start_codon:yes stop_codon:yes gene_type:complete